MVVSLSTSSTHKVGVWFSGWGAEVKTSGSLRALDWYGGKGGFVIISVSRRNGKINRRLISSRQVSVN